MHVWHLNISHAKILIDMDVNIHLFYQLVCVSRCSILNCNYLRLRPYRLRNSLRLSPSLCVSLFSHHHHHHLLSFVIITLRCSIGFSLLFSLCSSSFLLFASFSLIFFVCFLLRLHFFINTYYTCFFKCRLNTVLDKCTWYLTEQHWGIVRTVQIMRYYTYLNVKYGYLNIHVMDLASLSGKHALLG